MITCKIKTKQSLLQCHRKQKTLIEFRNFLVDHTPIYKHGWPELRESAARIRLCPCRRMSDGSTETDSLQLYPFTAFPYFLKHRLKLPRLAETLKDYMKTGIPVIAWHGSQHGKTNLDSSAQNSVSLSTELSCLHALRVLRVWPYVHHVNKNHCLTCIKIFPTFRWSLFPQKGTKGQCHGLFHRKKGFLWKIIWTGSIFFWTKII